MHSPSFTQPLPMASITKTASGYRAQVYVRGVRDSASFRTKREAEAWAGRRETELREQAAKAPAERITLAEVLQTYAAEVSPTKRGRRWETLRLDLFSRDPTLPATLPIGVIDATHISAWRDARIKQVSDGTVIREIGLLSAVFEHARREMRLIEHNPVRDVRKPRAPDHREVVIGWRTIRRMCRAMGYRSTGRITEVRQAAAVCFLVALRTGMRAGELTGLTWGRVMPGYCRTPHKTGRTADSLRDVPLSRRAQSLIERMRGWDDASVFGLSAATLDAIFRKYRARAGLNGFTFHDCRHTAATLIARRVDVLTLCKVFGWRGTGQALTYYNPKASDLAVMLDRR